MVRKRIFGALTAINSRLTIRSLVLHRSLQANGIIPLRVVNIIAILTIKRLLLGKKTEIDQDSYSSTKTGYDLDETFLFANATYDENTKAYIVQDVVMGNSTFTDISVKFEEGRFVSLTLTQVMGAQSATMELSAVYGDVNITLPTVTTLPPVVVDTEVTAEEWLAALSFTGVDNYEIVAASGGVEQTIRFDGTRVMTFGVNPSGGEIEQYYEKDGTNYYVYLVDAGVTQKEETTESSFFNAKTGGVAETFLASDFTYDAATKTYKAEEIVLFDGMVKYTDAEIKFENKKLVSMRYTYSFDNATPTAGTLDVTYGGVQTIEIPQV